MRKISPEYRNRNSEKLAEIRKSQFYQEIEQVYIPQLKTVFGNPPRG
jgi:hypothetical protein